MTGVDQFQVQGGMQRDRVTGSSIRSVFERGGKCILDGTDARP
jgi:hypothetical protein